MVGKKTSTQFVLVVNASSPSGKSRSAKRVSAAWTLFGWHSAISRLQTSTHAVAFHQEEKNGIKAKAMGRWKKWNKISAFVNAFNRFTWKRLQWLFVMSGCRRTSVASLSFLRTVFRECVCECACVWNSICSNNKFSSCYLQSPCDAEWAQEERKHKLRVHLHTCEPSPFITCPSFSLSLLCWRCYYSVQHSTAQHRKRSLVWSKNAILLLIVVSTTAKMYYGNHKPHVCIFTHIFALPITKRD